MRALARPAVLILIVIVAIVGDRAATAATPTPSPPAIPSTDFVATNNTLSPANQLTVTFGNPAASLYPMTQNPPGCGVPSYDYPNGFPPIYFALVVTWPTACVDPGESAEFTFSTDCLFPCPAPTVSSYLWSGPPTPPPVGGIVELATADGSGGALPWTIAAGLAAILALSGGMWLARRQSA